MLPQQKLRFEILVLNLKKYKNDMNSDIIFNADLDSTSIYVMKVFPADVTTVWNYFTRQELIDQWWGPKPWNCETIKMDFRENGIWHYAMVGPNGEKSLLCRKFWRDQ